VLADEAANATRCEALENTILRRRASSARNMGTTVRQRMRGKAGVYIQHFSFELAEASDETT